MRSQKNNPNNSLHYHIRGVFRGFETALARYLSTKNVPLSHFYILRLQWDELGASQKQIAQKSFMTESVASQVIKAMEKDELLQRKPDSSDARKKLVFLTRKGKSLRENIVMHGIEVSETHAPIITPEEFRTTIAVLMKIRASFDLYNAEYLKENS